jgi:hypothetical protein
MGGKPTTLFLGTDPNDKNKNIAGFGVADIKDAVTCSINDKTQLLCNDKTIGVVKTSYVDMAAFGQVSGSNAITDGFSIDQNGELHWKSPGFKSLKYADAIKTAQHEEAGWGLFQSKLTGNKILLYSQLGCPGGNHGNQHEMLYVGKGKAVALP